MTTGPPVDHIDARLAVNDLRIRYPGRREAAIDGVSFTIAAGERVGLAGRTGAGKSTLALASAGLIPRVIRARLQGAIRFGDIDVPLAPPGRLLGEVGIIFATPANQLSGAKLTVREELAFGLENLGMPRDQMDTRIDAVLDRLGVSELADREPFALSGGEQQRVAIASVVAMGANFLALDEPTAQLDPSGTEAVSELIAELARDGVAVLCIEHDPVVLGDLDRCLVLDHGRLLSDAEPGASLASAVLQTTGLEAPTIVRLAERAAVGPGKAFDEDSVVEALRGLPRGAADLTSRQGQPAPRAVTWQPASDRPSARIAVDDLIHRYPAGPEAVRGLTLSIEAGTATAIVGQNGSGKTTLVKHFNGLLRPTAGRVLIADTDTSGVPVDRLARTVGFVFQNPDDQLFNRSVEREVAFGPRNIGIDEPTLGRLVTQALGATGLDAAAATNPYDLSISERKLVALASVLAMDPAIVVLDEPTTGQDSPGVARVGAIVDALRAAGRTVVAITHDVEFAAEHFGRIVVMRQGTVVADGTPDVVFDPQNEVLLASTGLRPPVAARIGARLGLGSTPTESSLLAALAAQT